MSLSPDNLLGGPLLQVRRVKLYEPGQAPATWLSESKEDVLTRPTLAECKPNRFQRNLLRRYLGGECLLAIWGGIGCGKSVGLVMLAKAVAELRPGCRTLVVMRTYSDLMRIAFRNLRSVLGKAWKYRATRRVWIHPNGSEIELAYYDLKSTQHEGENPLDGADCHLVILDEANKYTSDLVFKHCQDRARAWAKDKLNRWHPPGLVINGRPSGVPWWPRAIEDTIRNAKDIAAEKGQESRVFGGVMHVKSYDNAAALGTDYFERQAAARTKEEYESLIEGGTFPEPGQLFGHWKWLNWPDGNVLHDFEFDPGGHTWLSIDPGIGYPAAGVFQIVDRYHPTFGFVRLHVLVDVMAPENITTPDFLELVRSRWWPRKYEDYAPDGIIGFINEVALDPWGGVQRGRDSGLTTEDWIRRKPPGVPGAGEVEHGLGLWVHKHTASASYRVAKTQRMIATGPGLRLLVVSPKLAERERKAKPTDRGWRHTQLAYKLDPKRGLPKKGGPGDPSGIADMVGDYLVSAAPDSQSHGTLDVEQLDLETGLYDVVGER